jgi:hypothetical protein
LGDAPGQYRAAACGGRGEDWGTNDPVARMT